QLGEVAVDPRALGLLTVRPRERAGPPTAAGTLACTAQRCFFSSLHEEALEKAFLNSRSPRSLRSAVAVDFSSVTACCASVPITANADAICAAVLGVGVSAFWIACALLESSSARLWSADLASAAFGVGGLPRSSSELWSVSTASVRPPFTALAAASAEPEPP